MSEGGRVAPGGEGAQGARGRALALVFTILLLDIIGMSLLYPVGAYIVRRYSDEALMVTLLTAVYAGAQFVAAPVLGKLGDRYGRRPVLLVSLGGSVVGHVLFGVGGALWVLFLARFIDGVTAGNQSTAAAYIADVSTPETRAKHFSLIGVAWGLGLILGPALGATLGQLNLAAPALAAAALSLVSVLVGLIVLPESLPRERRETAPLRATDLNPLGAIGAMARLPGLDRLLLAQCLFNLAFNGITSTETLFLIEKFALQPWQVGAMLVLGGATLVVVQRVVQPLARRLGERRVAVLSLLACALASLAMFWVPLVWPVYPLGVLRTAGSSFVFATLGVLMTGRVSPREQGVLMGVNTALGSVMGVLGPLWAGVAFDRLMPGAPYWLGAVVFALAALTLTRAHPGAVK
ncbi:MAG TPA: MFS transporter [Chloroflexota bacterium]|nr:MFS transporter [Chloroflexota bacterium]